MQRLHRRIAKSDYVLVERGTHYTPLEYPAEVNEAIERFLVERVFGESFRQ